MEHLKRYFKINPVIAALRDKNGLTKALNSNAVVLFILAGDISGLPDIMDKARNYDKLMFLHIDLMKGIASDKAAVKYLAENNLCDGIVTTRSKLIKEAQKKDLMAVQRLFLLDSAALRSGEKMIASNNPDAIEILPGIAAPYFIEHVSGGHDCPIIAGGLIRNREEIEDLVSAGVMAVSSSDSHLWDNRGV
ncbi:MAG: glycerol-3-phosphate responsive antiterminator [Halanaerobiaceae bacterium]